MDSVAYRYYLTGVGLFRQFMAVEFVRDSLERLIAQALQAFNAAVARDSLFAPAWAGLAETYFVSADWGVMSMEEAFALGHRSAERAVQLEPTSSHAQAVSGASAWYRMRWNTAKSRFERALELNPNNPSALMWYYQLLADLGLSELSRQLAGRLATIETSSAGALLNACFLARDYVCVEREGQALDPMDPNSCWVLALSKSLQGHHAQARSEFARCPVASDWDWARAMLDAIGGDTVSARRFLRQRAPGYARTSAAVVFAHIGELDSAFAVLQPVMRERGFINRLPSGSGFDPLRGDPRFDALLRVMNLECQYYEDGSHRCWEYGTRGEGI